MDNDEKYPKYGPKRKSTCHDYEENWALLTTVVNDFEFSIIAGLLEMGNIPVIRIAEGVDIIIGMPLGGIDIMVPKDKYEEARQLLNTRVDEETLEKEEESTE